MPEGECKPIIQCKGAFVVIVYVTCNTYDTLKSAQTCYLLFCLFIKWEVASCCDYGFLFYCIYIVFSILLCTSKILVIMILILRTCASVFPKTSAQWL